MATAYFFTHTQVRVDPTLPVRDWCLSDEGRARVIRLLRAPWLSHVARIVTSEERRLVETARIFADHRCVPVDINTGIRDSDRPLREFLSLIELDEAEGAFFARPEESARPGWESAADAQKRAVAAFDADLAGRRALAGDILYVGCGRVGTLLLCHLAGLPIAREHYQPTPGGNLFAFDRDSRTLLFRWRAVAPPR